MKITMAMWDLEPVNPVSGRKSRKGRKQRKVPEEQLTSGSERMVKTAADFMFAGASLAVISNLGSQVITSVSKK